MGIEEKLFIVFLICWIVSIIVIGYIGELRQKSKLQEARIKELKRENEFLRRKSLFKENEAEVQKNFANADKVVPDNTK